MSMHRVAGRALWALALFLFSVAGVLAARAGRHDPGQRQDRDGGRPFHHRAGGWPSRGSASSRSGKTPTSANSRGKDTKVIDLKGRTVIPGLIDNHAHWIRAAEHDELRFDGVTSRKQALKMLTEQRAQAAKSRRMDRHARRLVGRTVHRRSARLPAGGTRPNRAEQSGGAAGRLPSQLSQHRRAQGGQDRREHAESARAARSKKMRTAN